MSRQTARLALGQLVGRPALVAVSYGAAISLAEITSSNSLIADIRELATSDPAEQATFAQARRVEMANAYGYAEQEQNKPFAFANGKAIIPVHGVLINRFAYSWSFATGYNFIRAQLAAALADPDVDGIVLDVNSRGGMVAGCRETADAIYAANKPVLAMVDSQCFSAAYFLASQAKRIVVTPSGEAGSIGVVLMHMDVSKMMADVGVAVTFVYAGAHKVDGNPYEPLPESVRAEVQVEIDTVYDDFVSAVVRGRDMTDAAVRDTEARCYLAAEALTLGLIDAVQAPNDAVEAYFNADDDDDVDTDEGDDLDPDEPDLSTHVEEPTMATAPASAQPNTDAELARTQAAAAAQLEASATARTNERARIAGIQGHAEATGREALASHLALNTDLSVEASAGILAACPKPAAPVAAAAAAAPASEFQRAMQTGTHPNVGSGGASGDPEATVSPAQRILAAQARGGSVSRPRAAG